MKKFAVVIFSLLLAICSLTFFSACKEKERKTSYQIECTLSDDYVLSGREIVNFYNDTELTFKELKFNLFANSFRQGSKYSPIAPQYYHSAYPNGRNYGDMQILSVTEGEEWLEYSVSGEDENILKVNLKEEVCPNDTVSVCIEYSLSLASVIARTGYNEKTINLANFYPILCGIDNNGFYECLYYSKGDPYFSDCANYTVRFTRNNDYVVAFSGSLESEETLNNTITSTYKLNNARSFNMVLSKDFEVLTDTSTGTEIKYYYYEDENPSSSLEYAIKSINTFERLFGEYPYDTYSVVQTKFVQGGMEFPSLVMISDSVEHPAYGEVIVHETAHQWWQGVVGNNEIEYGFLDEGLAEYSVVLFYENNPEYSFTREELIKSSEQSYKTYCSVYDKLFEKTDTRMLRSLKEFTSEYEYVNICYIKPCIMYDYLRSTIGEEKFFNGLKSYYENNSFKNARPEDLVGAFEKTGADTNGFFDGFFNGKVII